MCGSGNLAWRFYTTPISWEHSDTHCQAQALVISNTSRCRSPLRLYSQVRSRLSSAGGTATTVIWSHAELPAMTRGVKEPYSNNMPSQPGLPLM